MAGFALAFACPPGQRKNGPDCNQYGQEDNTGPVAEDRFWYIHATVADEGRVENRDRLFRFWKNVDDDAIEKQNMQQHRHITVEFDKHLRNAADQKIAGQTHHAEGKAENCSQNNAADRNEQCVAQPHHGSPEMRF